MPFKKETERIIIVQEEDDSFKKIHDLGMEEACTQTLPFLSSFAQLSYKQCSFLLENFPNVGTTRTDTDQLVFLFALTDAVVNNFAYPPAEGTSMFSNKSNSFTKIMRSIEFAWEIVFIEITRKSKIVGYSIGIEMIHCLENLLKGCSKHLANSVYPGILDVTIKAAEDTKTILQRKLEKENGLLSVACPSSPTAQQKEPVTENGLLSVACLSSPTAQQKEPATIQLKVKSPSKLMSPSKLKSPLAFSQVNNELQNSPVKSTKIHHDNKDTERFILHDIESNSSKHGISCYCEMCLTPPQEKMQPSEKKMMHTKSMSPKKAFNNENIVVKSSTSPQAMSQSVKPSVKRPLFAQQQQMVHNKKPCLEEKPMLTNGKVNAFSFMMQKAKAKKA